MVLDGIFAQSNIIETGMQATVYRNAVYMNNMANVDTPGYKRQDVEFESYLSDIIQVSKSTGVLELSKAAPRITTPNAQLSYRLDGNNVDVDVEMTEIYKNSARYDALYTSVANNYKRIDMVLQAIR